MLVTAPRKARVPEPTETLPLLMIATLMLVEPRPLASNVPALEKLADPGPLTVSLVLAVADVMFSVLPAASVSAVLAAKVMLKASLMVAASSAAAAQGEGLADIHGAGAGQGAGKAAGVGE